MIFEMFNAKTFQIQSDLSYLNNRVDSLKMRGVGANSEPDVLVRRSVQPLDVGTQMVLDIPGSLVGGLEAGELGEDLLEGLPAHVGEDVEATAVGHAHDDGLDAEVGGLVHDLLHAGDQHLDAWKDGNGFRVYFGKIDSWRKMGGWLKICQSPSIH